MVLEAPFEEEITAMAITKLLDIKEQMIYHENEVLQE